MDKDVGGEVHEERSVEAKKERDGGD
ncbi:hypothetical protein PENANT_c001G04978 [Penicillium antarcticum]|uniref:Uncharacterized protein n=1 Tax=Penicillium antarcticum TaxID=416450 RepID=A0A1V6QMU0_9EURO|nr:hypothetical protein PENANT_c001G04978 [Penicillium antarcticum]